MMTMVDKYLATEMFVFTALSQISIALFIYHGGWPCELCQRAFKAKATNLRPRPNNPKVKAKKSGLEDKAKDQHP